MSLKICNRAFPLLFNALKNHKTILVSKECLRFVHIQPPTFNLCQNVNQSQQRCLSKEARIKEKKERKNDIKTVYYGVLTPQIRAVKMFSLTSSIVGVIAQPFLYKEIASLGNIPVTIAAYSFIGFFTFVTPILLHIITKKYITHLDYNPKTETYTAKTVNFFCMTREIEFKPEEVVIPEVPAMFASFHVRGRPLFLDPRLFENLDHYKKIMGFDKPIDFKLYEGTTEAAPVEPKIK